MTKMNLLKTSEEGIKRISREKAKKVASECSFRAQEGFMYYGVALPENVSESIFEYTVQSYFSNVLRFEYFPDKNSTSRICEISW
jgi:hypothetical protein